MSARCAATSVAAVGFGLGTGVCGLAGCWVATGVAAGLVARAVWPDWAETIATDMAATQPATSNLVFTESSVVLNFLAYFLSQKRRRLSSRSALCMFRSRKYLFIYLDRSILSRIL